MSQRDSKVQGSMVRKKGELNLYDKFGTRRGGHGALIEPITMMRSLLCMLLIAGKVMKNYSKGECTLGCFVSCHFCAQGAQMNWCKYLMNEMLQACAWICMRGVDISSMGIS
jgi:hypothetical protein